MMPNSIQHSQASLFSLILFLFLGISFSQCACDSITPTPPASNPPITQPPNNPPPNPPLTVTDDMVNAAKAKGGCGLLATVLEKLKKGEAVDINQKSSTGTERTALDEAVYLGDLGILKILLKEGADPNEPDENGNTALHRALACVPFSTGDMVEVVKLLLNNVHIKADKTKLNKSNESPAYIALHNASSSSTWVPEIKKIYQQIKDIFDNSPSP